MEEARRAATREEKAETWTKPEYGARRPRIRTCNISFFCNKHEFLAVL
jgi:hypothetical protein